MFYIFYPLRFLVRIDFIYCNVFILFHISNLFLKNIGFIPFNRFSNLKKSNTFLILRGFFLS